MPAKKKAAVESREPVPEVKAPTQLVQDREKWIILEFKLLNWKYMNFTMKFREETHIFSIKKILLARHGRMNDLKICFHSFTESNEVNNDMLKLTELGLKGNPINLEPDESGNTVPENIQLPTVVVYYDYKPADFEDPVLLYFKT